MRTRSVPNKTPAPDWPRALSPLLARFAGRKHPLEYRSRYELLVMVVLSSRTTDKAVNAIAPVLFRRYPDIAALAAAEPEDLHPYVKTIPGFVKKSSWLVAIARAVGGDARIPATMEGLTALPGIGRKSANVIIGESGGAMEGVIVDLHVLRVAPRIGIARGTTPEEIEKELMAAVPRSSWHDLGMSLTYLGRELCRPTDPHCPACPLLPSCAFARGKRAGRTRSAAQDIRPRR
jgi:endonuclease-3